MTILQKNFFTSIHAHTPRTSARLLIWANAHISITFFNFRLNFFSVFDGFNLNFPHEERLFIVMPFRTENKRKIHQQEGSGIIKQI